MPHPKSAVASVVILTTFTIAGCYSPPRPAMGLRLTKAFRPSLDLIAIESPAETQETVVGVTEEPESTSARERSHKFNVYAITAALNSDDIAHSSHVVTAAFQEDDAANEAGSKSLDQLLSELDTDGTGQTDDGQQDAIDLNDSDLELEDAEVRAAESGNRSSGLDVSNPDPSEPAQLQSQNNTPPADPVDRSANQLPQRTSNAALDTERDPFEDQPESLDLFEDASEDSNTDNHTKDQDAGMQDNTEPSEHAVPDVTSTLDSLSTPNDHGATPVPVETGEYLQGSAPGELIPFESEWDQDDACHAESCTSQCNCTSCTNGAGRKRRRGRKRR